MDKNMAVSTTNAETQLSVEDQEMMDLLKQGSGEEDNQKINYLNIPYLTIDNSKEEIDVKGRKVKTLCEGRFLLNYKEGDEYKKEIFIDKFDAIILAFRHRLQRKLIVDNQGKIANTMPYFRSLEFANFKSQIHVRMNNEWQPPMTYQQIKHFSNEESELWGVVYFIIEGEDEVRKLEVKGASRSELFDLMTQKRVASISSFWTRFSIEVGEKGNNPFNKLKLEILEKERPDLGYVVRKQRELLELLGDGKPSKKLETQVVQAELVDNSQVDTEKLLKAINEIDPNDIFDGKQEDPLADMYASK